MHNVHSIEMKYDWLWLSGWRKRKKMLSVFLLGLSSVWVFGCSSSRTCYDSVGKAEQLPRISIYNIVHSTMHFISFAHSSSFVGMALRYSMAEWEYIGQCRRCVMRLTPWHSVESLDGQFRCGKGSLKMFGSWLKLNENFAVRIFQAWNGNLKCIILVSLIICRIVGYLIK